MSYGLQWVLNNSSKYRLLSAEEATPPISCERARQIIAKALNKLYSTGHVVNNLKEYILQ